MISKEAQQAIEMMQSGKLAAAKAMKEAKNPTDSMDPLLQQIKGIFAERKMGNERALQRKLPDKLSLVMDHADGVHGEWLRYLDSDPEKIKEKVILFLHGGGFNTGSALSRRNMAANIALNAKVDSFSIDYRLCPEYKFPAHLDDCATTFLWLLKKGYNPKNIIVFGESAGANLALCLPLYLKDHYLPTPGGVCAFSPVVDLDAHYDSRVLRSNRDPMIGGVIDQADIEKQLEILKNAEPKPSLYVTVEEIKSPYASPIYGDFTGFPKLSIHVGTEEILFDDSIAVEKKAKAAGVDVSLHIWEGLFHCFPLFGIPEGDIACKEIGDFIRSV